MNYGFVKVASAVPMVRVADCKYNVAQMLPMIQKAATDGVEIIAFPRYGITSCSCGDLFKQQILQNNAEEALSCLLKETSNIETIIIIGMPVTYAGTAQHCSIVMHRGKLIGATPDKGLEGYITLCGQTIPAGNKQLYKTKNYTFTIASGNDSFEPLASATYAALHGAEIIICQAANHELAGRHDVLVRQCCAHSRRTISGYIYSGCGYGESSSDLIYSGDAMIIENGKLLAKSKRFIQESRMEISEIDAERLQFKRRSDKTFQSALTKITHNDYSIIEIMQEQSDCTQLTRKIEALPFIPAKEIYSERCEEIFSIQAAGLAKRIQHTNSQSCIIGISGGLDSTLALLVTVKAIDMLHRKRSDIIGITMPGFGTTDRTYQNALSLMKQLGITTREVSIKEACIQHFKDIEHNIENHDTTYENSQARERTQILMDISNQMNGLVVGTGDLSELALGWATYNGDHMSMYGVNASVPKTLVQHLVRWVANNTQEEGIRTTLLDIVDTPISPELLPADNCGNIAQKTEDLVGPYELHDFFLYNFINNGYSPKKLFYLSRQAFAGTYDDDTIKKWLNIFFRRFFTQQFKRSCMPDGPKVGTCSLSPRDDWHMTSDTSYAIWESECKNL